MLYNYIILKKQFSRNNPLILTARKKIQEIKSGVGYVSYTVRWRLSRTVY